MANRRYGHGNRPHYGGVNPWEGGSFPGNSGSSGLLSQLSDPQAQLAIALTKLLQPPQPQVTSLLHMDPIPPPYSTYGNSDFRRRNDFRRNEPFNKSQRNRDDYRRRDNKNRGKNSKNEKAKASEDKTKDSEGDATVKVDNEESTDEQKRDWKDEKNDSKAGETDDEEGKKEKMDVDKTEDGEEKEVYKGPYAGIPAELLHCRICDKRMWSGESFERHVKGRAHQLMCDTVEESYRIKADMLRESIRLLEEKNNIKIDKMERYSDKFKSLPRSYCTMCQLDYRGVRHRGSAGHKTLKNLLHPHCNYCDKEFPTRMEWESHRHTADHFKRVAEKMKAREESDVKEAVLIDPEEEEVPLFFDDAEISDVITDITSDMEEFKHRLPTYMSNRAVGASLVKEISGFHCDPCQYFFTNKERSEKHLRSKGHFENFLKILKEKQTAQEEKKRKEAEERENEEGNWKRRKVENKDEEMDDNENDATEENDNTKDETMETNGDDVYNPEDSFVDPNEADLTKNDEDIKDEDKIWKEVDKELDNILDTTGEEKEDPKEDPKPTRGGPRARRGRKATK